MSGWTRHEGLAVLLPEDNIDTDRLIQARFMSAPRREGYGRFLLHDARFGPDGSELTHPLNDTPATVLVAGRNFGCGSSREAAVYALVDFGVRAVLAPSFGDIFASNAVGNGLLPAVIEEEAYAALTGYLADPQSLDIDLETMTVSFGDRQAALSLDPVWRTKIIRGWDDIDLTARHRPALDAFAAARRAMGWTWPASE
ncbi:3-isopropylmalate dehydratase small subunit [Sulfitobacter sp. D35]|uniref:3-isopropylmalate dehydratase small subunit n=1 Tax=Sulfitobacter sp. D35 TaxID=3083252 RepID=UPI00296E5A30|nr:3-isopropylmalate dehydratase small subunit [Sulfitobacter sp. D35]MDW4499192.1 3-isopropylmalate dehydratase small subunit [Sulfitobacter sp. D35]